MECTRSDPTKRRATFFKLKRIWLELASFFSAPSCGSQSGSCTATQSRTQFAVPQYNAAAEKDGSSGLGWLKIFVFTTDWTVCHYQYPASDGEWILLHP